MIEHLDWAECLTRYDRPETLFYLDPPYWETAGYGTDFGIEQYERMAELARTAKGQVVISVNDVPKMREVFQGLDLQTTQLRYTVGRDATKPKGELVIVNC